MIKSGTGVIARRHAKNYISAQADLRLREAIDPYRAQGMNALGVDSFPVHYFYKARGTTTCTCKQTEITQHSVSSTGMPIMLLNPDAVGETEIAIDYARPLFGNQNENGDSDEETEDDEFAIDDVGNPDDGAENPVMDSLLSSSPDCGICYRTGYVPGYNLYGHERLVLTTHHVSSTYGYNLERHTTPHTFNKLDAGEGNVRFNMTVPKYFKSVELSVRNNTEHLVGENIYAAATGLPIALADLRYYGGSEIEIEVRASRFTHLVVAFDLGSDIIHANLAQMTRTLDWTMFSTIGNLQIILPMTIQEVQAEDLVWVPLRRIALKVTDVTYLRTANERNLDWAVTTRVLQPQESLKYIDRGQKIV